MGVLNVGVIFVDLTFKTCESWLARGCQVKGVDEEHTHLMFQAFCSPKLGPLLRCTATANCLEPIIHRGHDPPPFKEAQLSSVHERRL